MSGEEGSKRERDGQAAQEEDADVGPPRPPADAQDDDEGMVGPSMPKPKKRKVRAGLAACRVVHAMVPASTSQFVPSLTIMHAFLFAGAGV